MKKTIIKIQLVSLFLLLHSQLSLANIKSDQPNNCVYLSIMISNNTKKTCQLIDSQVIYGRMSSSTQAPVLIPPGTSAYPFEMRQIIYGPDIILTYECGAGYRVSFETQQNFCLMQSGEITSNVLYSNGLSANSIINRGSYLWNRHGVISWILNTQK